MAIKALKKGLIITLATAMITTAIPVGAFADEDQSGASEPVAQVEQAGQEEGSGQTEPAATGGAEQAVTDGAAAGQALAEGVQQAEQAVIDGVHAEAEGTGTVTQPAEETGAPEGDGKEWKDYPGHRIDFYIRLDGAIPTEPNQYPSTEYTESIPVYAENGEIVEVKTTQQVDFKYSQKQRNDWICDSNVAEAMVVKGQNYLENDVTAALSAFPTDQAIKDALKKKSKGKNNYSYDPETQKVLWYVLKEAGTKIDGKSEPNIHIDGVIVNRFSLAYDPNGVECENLPLGFSVSEAVDVEAGADAKADGDVKSPYTDGYKFVGWATSAKPESDEVMEAGKKFKLEKNTTLYAQWEKVDNVALITDSDKTSSIDPYTNWENDKKDYVYSETKNVKVSFSADKYYRIDSVEVDGDQLTGSALEEAITNGYVTVDRKKDHSVKVTSTVDLSQIKVTFTAPSAEKTYDGTPLTAVEGVTAEGFDVLADNGYKYTAKGTGTITNAGKESNGVDYEIRDPEGEVVCSSNDVNSSSADEENSSIKVEVVEGTLKVNPVEVTVTVGEYSKKAGAKDPTFKAELTGAFVGDDAAKIVYTISRAEGEKAGEYVITPSGDEVQGNYVVKYVPGKLTITEATNEGGGRDGGRTSGDSSEGEIVTIADVEVPLAELNTVDHMAYIIGYEDGTVRPQNKITRAEVASIFFRLLTDESRQSIWSTVNSYIDVAASQWYNNGVSTLSNGKILTGYEDGTFRPDGSITRAEFATIACRFDDTPVNTEGISFTDIEGHWANKYILRAAALGYINGYEDGSFKPNEPITRAEAATLMNRVLGRNGVTEGSFLPDMKTWSDNQPGSWYYLAMQEATNSHDYEINDDRTEKWTAVNEAPDWSALEKSWSDANSVISASVHGTN